jgi:hypothetical protein
MGIGPALSLGVARCNSETTEPPSPWKGVGVSAGDAMRMGVASNGVPARLRCPSALRVFAMVRSEVPTSEPHLIWTDFDGIVTLSPEPSQVLTRPSIRSPIAVAVRHREQSAAAPTKISSEAELWGGALNVAHGVVGCKKRAASQPDHQA